MNKLGIILLILTVGCGAAFGQKIEAIQADTTYLWGEGIGKSLEEADRKALKDLGSQISIKVYSSLETRVDNRQYGDNAVSRTHTKGQTTIGVNVQLNHCERVYEVKNRRYRVLRYIKRSELANIYENSSQDVAITPEEVWLTEEDGKVPVEKKDNVFTRFYANSGDYYIGFVGAGYMYSPPDQKHYLSFSVVPMRFKLFELRALDVEVKSYPFGQQLVYKPTVGVVIPVEQRWTVGVYGGISMDLNRPFGIVSSTSASADNGFFLAPLGGIRVGTTTVAMCPMYVFIEYRYPVITATTSGTQNPGIRFGFGMSVGAPKWKNENNK